MKRMNKMKKLVICCLISFLVIFLLSYLSGFNDDIFREKYYEGIWYKDLINYFIYYVMWVLPYWWLILLLGSMISGIVMFLFVIVCNRILYYFRSRSR